MKPLMLSSQRLTALFAVALFAAAGCSSSPDVADDPPPAEDMPDELAVEEEADQEEEDAPSLLEQRLEEEAEALASDDDYTILFSQDGEYVPIDDYHVHLQPQPFEIHVVTTGKTPAAVNISTNRDALQAFRARRPFPEDVGAPGSGMAERPRNPGQLIFVDPQGLNVWGYMSETDHRFDDVQEIGERFVGTRNIENLFDPDTQESTSIEAAVGAELHFIEFGVADEDDKREPKRAYTVVFVDEASAEDSEEGLEAEDEESGDRRRSRADDEEAEEDEGDGDRRRSRGSEEDDEDSSDDRPRAR